MKNITLVVQAVKYKDNFKMRKCLQKPFSENFYEMSRLKSTKAFTLEEWPTLHHIPFCTK